VLYLDSVTAQHLELLHNNRQPASAHSLLGILSNCRTPGGSRLLRMNILQPPYDLKLIQLRLDCIEELMDEREVLHGLQVSERQVYRAS
jgi:DNA mismatch repair ATPase MutS